MARFCILHLYSIVYDNRGPEVLNIPLVRWRLGAAHCVAQQRRSAYRWPVRRRRFGPDASEIGIDINGNNNTDSNSNNSDNRHKGTDYVSSVEHTHRRRCSQLVGVAADNSGQEVVMVAVDLSFLSFSSSFASSFQSDCLSLIDTHRFAAAAAAAAASGRKQHPCKVFTLISRR